MMAGFLDSYELAKVPPAPAPPPGAPKSFLDAYELAPTAGAATPRAAEGFVESVQAGVQGSAIGLMWRGKLPDLVMNPNTAAWWERLATGVSGVAADLPIMIPAGAAGAAAGTASAGPVGGILAGGAAMFAAPAGIKTSLMEVYKAGAGETPADWFNIVREVAKSMLHEGAIGAATFGAGAVARGGAAALMGASGQAATAVGLGTATMATRGASKVAGTADVAAQIAAMVTMPAALEGRLPEKREFLDVAAVILTLKGAHVAIENAGVLRTTAQRIANVYERTGKTPAEQLADAQADPNIANELTRAANQEATGTTSGVPLKLDRLVAEAQFLARGGVPEAPNIKAIIKEIKEAGPLQGDMVRDLDRLDTLSGRQDLNPAEKAEFDALTEKFRAQAEAAAENAPRGTITPEPPPAPRFAPDQLTEAAERARARLEALTEKATREALTDAERAERIGLTNAMGNPEALAKRFGIEPAIKPITDADRQASAQRVYDDVLRQAQENNAARQAAGLEPLGDEHALAVATLMRARILARATRLGVLPEDLYNERPLQIRDDTQSGTAAAAAIIPPEAPRFVPPPEVDLFGNPILPTDAPRVAGEAIATVPIPIVNLKLSKDVPQFKAGANARGVVQPLQGEVDLRGVAPIAVWERLNGDLEVISGRHRLDLWERKGKDTIDAQVFKESEGFDIRQATMLDAEMNIRDEHGSVSDYANYFKNSGISEETAKSRGLLGRAKGQAGFRIAHDAVPDLLAAHRAGLLSDDAALVISSTAPGSERLQALGMAMVNEGKSTLFAANMMRAVDLMVAERQSAGLQGDLWNFDDSATREAAAMSKKASSAQRKISEQISAVSGASRRPEIARKLGVDVQDPEGVQKKIAELKQEQYQWDNWPLYPELVAKLRAGDEGAAKEPAPVYTIGDEIRQGEGRFEAGRVETTEGQFDLFTPAPIPDSPVKTLEKIVVEPEQVGKREVAFNRVRDAGEAASVFQDLNRSPMEKFQVLGLDAKDKPIAFFDMFAGTLSQTSVFPREVWTAIYQTPGIKSVWIAHQHPSGLAEPSHADRILTKSLQAVLTPDIGVTLRGHLIITKNKTIDIGPEGNYLTAAAPKTGTAKKSIPIMERMIVKSEEDGTPLSSPAAVRDFLRSFAPSETGILVVDTQHKPTGWWPMTVEQMKTLRTSDATTGMGALMRNVGRANAGAAIAYSPKPSDLAFESAVRNVGTALQLADVKMLDVFTVEEGGRLNSYAERGLQMTNVGGTFFQSAPRELFELKPETPAELKDRDAEAVAAAKRKLAQERAGVKGPIPTVDQADMFAHQRTLFQRPGQERDGQHLGSYSVAENLITTFRNANKSTIIHELSHSWLEEMKADAARPDAPAQIKADWDMIRREFAIGENGEISTASHEQFARTGERYLGEGKAPSIGLRAVFEQFKTWMLQIYSNLQNLGVNINPEIRGLFDRMLATDQEIADARAMDVPRVYVPEARREAAERIVPPAPEGRKIEPGFAAEKASMEPYADEMPKGPGEAPDSSHINYAYINSPMDVKLAMQRMAEIDQANIQKQRGGTQGVKSWAEANAEQARYVNDVLGGSEDTLRILSPRDPDAAGPDVKLGILKKLAVGAAKDSARLRDVVLEAGHDATVRQQLEYMGSIERARMIQAEFLGERAGVARALNALKDVTEGTGEIARMLDAIGYGEAAARELFQAARTPAEEQAYMRLKLDEILQNYKGRTVLDIAKLHKEIGTLKGTFKFSKEVTKATKWEMVVEGWKASLLSGPVTHTTNLFGTEGFHFLRPAVDALAATIGMARGASPGMGESDRASMSEAVARLGGMISGVKDGVKVAVATFKLDDPTGKTEAYRTAIPGRAGELIRIPLRLMGAEDALVTTMYKRGELATLAIRQAFDEQMNPSTREFAERVSYLKDNPTPEMQAAADAAAIRMTFNAPLGEKGVALQLFVNKWNLQWMIPFIRTPINITKEVARMSPLAPLVGEWRAAIAKGGVERDRALAELAIGTGIMALAMAMTFDATLSGAGSPDPGKNRGKVGVWQPYSRLIGDTWYEYARIQPVGTLVGMAADVATIWDHMNDEERDKIPKLLAVAFSNAVTNQTFLQGITNVINAMSEPTRFLPRFANQMAGSMVPNIIGQPTAMADPVVREVNGMLEAIQARIPGLRQDLLPKLDWLGEPVETKERVAGVMPVRTLKVSEDKVRLEAARLELSLAAAPKKTHIGKGTGKLGDVELTPEERNTFAKVGGEFAHQILDNIVNAPGYENIPDMIKRKIFRDVIAKSHQLAAAAALPIDKRLAYMQSITERVTAELQPSEAQ